MANYTASDITTDEQAALDQIKEETEAAVKYDIAAKNAKDPVTKEAMEHNKKDEIEHAGLMGAVAVRENPEDKSDMMAGVKELDDIKTETAEESFIKKSISQCIREKQGRMSSPGTFESFEKGKASGIDPNITNRQALKDIARLETGRLPNKPLYNGNDEDKGLLPERFRRLSYNPMGMLMRLALGLGEYQPPVKGGRGKTDVFENEKYTDEDISDVKTDREKRVADTELAEDEGAEEAPAEKRSEKEKKLDLTPSVARMLGLLSRDYSSKDIPIAKRGDKASNDALRAWRSGLGSAIMDLIRGTDSSDLSDRMLSSQKWAQPYLGAYSMGDTSDNEKVPYDWGTPAFSTYEMDPSSLGSRYNDAVRMIDTIDKLRAQADGNFAEALDGLKRDWMKYLRKVSGAIGWDLAARNEKTDEYDARAHPIDDAVIAEFGKRFGPERAELLKAGGLNTADMTDDEKNYLAPLAFDAVAKNDFWRNHAGGFNFDDMMNYYNFITKAGAESAPKPESPAAADIIKEIMGKSTNFKDDEGAAKLLESLIDAEGGRDKIAEYIKGLKLDPIRTSTRTSELANLLSDVRKKMKESTPAEEKPAPAMRGPRAQWMYNKGPVSERNKRSAQDILDYAAERGIELSDELIKGLKHTAQTGDTKDKKDPNALDIFGDSRIKGILKDMETPDPISEDYVKKQRERAELERMKMDADEEARKAIDNAPSKADQADYGTDENYTPPSVEDITGQFEDFYNKATSDPELVSQLMEYIPEGNETVYNTARKQLSNIGRGFYSDLPEFMDSGVGRKAIMDMYRDLGYDFDEAYPLDQGPNRELLSQLTADGKFFNMRGQDEASLIDFLAGDKTAGDDDEEDDMLGDDKEKEFNPAKIKGAVTGEMADLLRDYMQYDKALKTGKFGDFELTDDLVAELTAGKKDLADRMNVLIEEQNKPSMADVYYDVSAADTTGRGLYGKKKQIEGSEDYNARKAKIAQDILGNIPLNFLSMRVPVAYSPKTIEKYKDQDWFDPKSGTTSVFDRMMRVYGGRDEYGRPIWNHPKKGDLDQIEGNVKKFLELIGDYGKMEFAAPTGNVGADAKKLAQYQKVDADRMTENAAYIDSVYPLLNQAFFNGLNIDNFGITENESGFGLGDAPDDKDKFYNAYMGKMGKEPEAAEEAVKEEVAQEAAPAEILEEEEIIEPEKVAEPIKRSATESKCTRVRRRSDADDLPDDTGLTEKDLKEPTIHSDANGSSVKHMGDSVIKKSISELMKERMSRR